MCEDRDSSAIYTRTRWPGRCGWLRRRRRPDRTGSLLDVCRISRVAFPWPDFETLRPSGVLVVVTLAANSFRQPYLDVVVVVAGLALASKPEELKGISGRHGSTRQTRDTAPAKETKRQDAQHDKLSVGGSPMYGTHSTHSLPGVRGAIPIRVPSAALAVSHTPRASPLD